MSDIIALKPKPELVKMVYDLLDENRKLREAKEIKPITITKKRVKVVYLFHDIKPKKPDEVFDEVCEKLKLTKQQILSKKRTSNLLIARCLVCYYLKCSGCSLSEIGRILNRDHSTIINSLKKYEKYKSNAEII